MVVEFNLGVVENVIVVVDVLDYFDRLGVCLLLWLRGAISFEVLLVAHWVGSLLVWCYFLLSLLSACI